MSFTLRSHTSNLCENVIKRQTGDQHGRIAGDLRIPRERQVIKREGREQVEAAGHSDLTSQVSRLKPALFFDNSPLKFTTPARRAEDAPRQPAGMVWSRSAALTNFRLGVLAPDLKPGWPGLERSEAPEGHKT